MRNSLRVDKDVPIEVRDGVVLRADIVRPDDKAPHPAILIRTPYNKALTVTSDFLNVIAAAFAGFAVVIQDIRGRFASEGQWRRGSMFTVEGPDGYDTIEWVASQRWCDGKVGMAGGSYLAGLQWAAAMESPPSLKAMAPWMGIWGAGMEPRPTGGAILLSVAATATPMMAVDVADRLEREGHDVGEMRQAIQWGLDNPDEVLNFLPLKDVPFARFDPIRELWEMRLRPPDPREGAKRQRFENVLVPCFYACGWFDIIEWASFESFYRMKARGGTPVAREGQYLLIGPWMHGRLLDFLGNVHFGRLAGGRSGQVSEHNLAFFRKYLQDRDIEIPKIQYFVMGANVWRTAEEWPLPQTTWQRFFLHSQGKANTAAGDGWLSRDTPASEPPDVYNYDPFNPVPTVGGRLFGIGLVPGPLEQYHVEKREDVLCYTTGELAEDVEVSGPLELHLFAATSARDTDFTAKLVDVYPGGRAYNIAEGIIRASGRNLTGERELVNPGEVYEYVIGLGNTSHLFRKGHRLRIDISSSNFPAFDRNMNTGNPTGEDSSGRPAAQRIHHQEGAASYIDLPIIPVEKE